MKTKAIATIGMLLAPTVVLAQQDSYAIPTRATDIMAPGEYAQQQAEKQSDYERVLELMVPLSPARIEEVIQLLGANERAASQQASPPPAPIMAVENLDIHSRTPPVIRVAQGYGASVVFTDNTGNVWPIVTQQGFNDGLFVVSAERMSGDPNSLPTVLTVQPVAAYGMGNIMVTLKNLPTPIILMASLGQGEVDIRKEFRLPMAGPNATVSYTPPLPGGLTLQMLNVLNGLPPMQDAKTLRVSGIDADARGWAAGQYYYLLTRANITSPSYTQKTQSANGTYAYQLPRAPVMLAYHQGNAVEVMVSEP